MGEHTAVRDDWKIEDMPPKSASFILSRSFSPDQMEILHRGHVPMEMEDKWFWYMEENRLYAHRSWTGICIYVIEFKPDNRHVVTVNRDPQQYPCDSIEEDLERVSGLLEYWSKPCYDYYGEWLSETRDAIEKSRASGSKTNTEGKA